MISKKTFILKFTIFIIIIYLILQPLENYLILTVTYHSYLLLRIFTNATYCENRIHLNKVDLEVEASCTGVIFISIYLALLLSLSKNIREVLIGLPLLLLIYLGNLLRIFLTGILGEIFIEDIHRIHDLVGYFITPIFSVIVTGIYLKILSKMRNK